VKVAGAKGPRAFSPPTEKETTNHPARSVAATKVVEGLKRGTYVWLGHTSVDGIAVG